MGCKKKRQEEKKLLYYKTISPCNWIFAFLIFMSPIILGRSIKYNADQTTQGSLVHNKQT